MAKVDKDRSANETEGYNVWVSNTLSETGKVESMPSMLNGQVMSNDSLGDDHTHNLKDETPEGSEPVACPKCDMTFTRYHNLKAHMPTHTLERPFACEVCNSKFRRMHDLNRHRKLHTGERPFVCTKCGRKFARMDALARHTKGPHGCAQGKLESEGINHMDSNDISRMTKSITPTSDGFSSSNHSTDQLVEKHFIEDIRQQGEPSEYSLKVVKDIVGSKSPCSISDASSTFGSSDKVQQDNNEHNGPCAKRFCNDEATMNKYLEKEQQIPSSFAHVESFVESMNSNEGEGNRDDYNNYVKKLEAKLYAMEQRLQAAEDRITQLEAPSRS